MKPCTAVTEVYSRIVGYLRPVKQWNPGKREEFFGRKVFDVKGIEPLNEGIAIPKDNETSR